jgi:16S rRNA (cytosine1402-N4)-methyltransferase
MPVEVLSHLNVVPTGSYLDLTLGGGGHTQALCERTRDQGKVTAVDRDPEAIARAQEKFAHLKHLTLVHASWKDACSNKEVLAQAPFDGVVIDCGVSSDQLDRSLRGFSIQNDGPLDMRMDPTSGPTAKEFLSHILEKDLANLIYEYGEERKSRSIARSIVKAVRDNHLDTTKDLANAVLRGLSPDRKHTRIHPATRTFQAIRIALNDELGQLKDGLNLIQDQMAHRGRIVVLTFHSLEDRIVKNVFRNWEKDGLVQILTKKPIGASEDERSKNPRARSAKLRAAQFVEGEA